uniref:Putative reverse transcriptase n=1 Tax=Anopheles darlingi TaxID=43151 RepID=A0A2M4CUU6_ANODA
MIPFGAQTNSDLTSRLPSETSPLLRKTLPSTCASLPYHNQYVSGVRTKLDDPRLAHTHRHLRIYYQNVRGLRTKLLELSLALTECDFDIIVFTETWLDATIPSALLNSKRYVFHRTDRSSATSSHQRGGGVLIAVASDLRSQLITHHVRGLEQVWTKVNCSEGALLIGAIYLPPNISSDSCQRTLLNESLLDISSRMKSNDRLLLIGDFNQPSISWCQTASSDLASGGQLIFLTPSSHSSAGLEFIDMMDSFNLFQLNGAKNHLERTLDLVYADVYAAQLTSVSTHVDPLLPIDLHHPPLEILSDISVSSKSPDTATVSRFDFKRTDFEKLNNLIRNFDSSSLVNNSMSIDEIVEELSAFVRAALACCVPVLMPEPHPPWSNERLKALKRKRVRALRRYRKRKTNAARAVYSDILNRYRNTNRSRHSKYVFNLQRSMGSHPKRFWNLVKSRRGSKAAIPKTLHYDGMTTDTDAESCELFAARFSKCFVSSNNCFEFLANAVRDTPPDVIDFPLLVVDESMVGNAIARMKQSYHAGPDGIPACVVKGCSDVLAPLLTMIFNKSFRLGYYPVAWKTSWMRPVLKKGDPSDVSNYRGVTSLNAFAKVIEIVVQGALFNCSRQIISPLQHGFFPRRSTTSLLFEFVSHCKRSLDRGLQIDAVYTDFRAAFDSVSHPVLLAKLTKLGCSEPMVCWFRSYLLERCFCVQLNDSLSRCFVGTSGVPQGSNLGPLLFLLYINDVTTVINGCRILLYADDARLFHCVQSSNDCDTLQHNLRAFQDWSDRNELILCVEKCQVVSFSRCKSKITYDYHIYGKAITKSECVRDLGLLIDSRLSFIDHRNSVISKSYKLLGLVFRMTADFSDPMCIKAVYCSLVRSVLEQDCVVWCPYTANHISRIEKIQRRFTRFALRRLSWIRRGTMPPYFTRCLLLGLEPLSMRRAVSQCSFIAGLLEGSIDSPSLLDALDIHVPARNLRSSMFLSVANARSIFGRFEPLTFAVRQFNANFARFNFGDPLRSYRDVLRLNVIDVVSCSS